MSKYKRIRMVGFESVKRTIRQADESISFTDSATRKKRTCKLWLDGTKRFVRTGGRFASLSRGDNPHTVDIYEEDWPLF